MKDQGPALEDLGTNDSANLEFAAVLARSLRRRDPSFSTASAFAFAH